jgi:RNA polymerase sigma factor (sigma-70 family)
MATSDAPSDPVPGVPTGPLVTTSRRLLWRVRRGDRSALDAIVARHLGPLRRWARGRLPQWARTISDTADLVQEAIFQTLGQLEHFEPKAHGALQAYLRRAVDNRINDEFRRIARRGVADVIDEEYRDPSPSPHEQAVAGDLESRYRDALTRLRTADRRLIVGRVEFGYSIEQLALLTGRQRSGAARVALRRALERLAAEMDRA